MQVFMQRVKRAAVVTQKYCYSWGCLPCWGKEQQCVLTLASDRFPREICFWRHATVSLWYFGNLCLATTEQQILKWDWTVSVSFASVPQFLYTSFLSLMFCLTYTEIQFTSTLKLLKFKYEVHCSQHNYWYWVNNGNTSIIVVMYQALVQPIAKLSISCNTPL